MVSVEICRTIPIMSAADSESHEIKVRYTGACGNCGKSLPAGSSAKWDAISKSLSCVGGCTEGAAGGSAQREYDRRREKYEAAVKGENPILAPFILKFGNEPQRVKAWQQGADGEVAVGHFLDQLTEFADVVVFHDRRIRGTKANIDHIVVSPAGVYVIDAKNYTGLVTIDKSGGWLSPVVKTLRVGGRDCTKLVEGVKRQVDKVATTLDPLNIPISTSGILAFYLADWPWVGMPQEVDGVLVNGKGLRSLIATTGQLSSQEVRIVADRIRKTFPQS